jgi:hypothetical protein
MKARLPLGAAETAARAVVWSCAVLAIGQAPARSQTPVVPSPPPVGLPAAAVDGNRGDTGVQARFPLIERRNFSMVTFVGERIPTGKSVNGDDINGVTPGLEAWWNFAPDWVVRGGTSVNIDTGRKTATSVHVNQLSLGRDLTGKDAAFPKDLEVHVTGSVLSDVAGGSRHVDDVDGTPGFRFGVGEGETWYVLGGVQVPVSGPQPCAW